ncbi:hypothetical protein [Actinophytocola sediminis]
MYVLGKVLAAGVFLALVFSFSPAEIGDSGNTMRVAEDYDNPCCRMV